MLHAYHDVSGQSRRIRFQPDRFVALRHEMFFKPSFECSQRIAPEVVPFIGRWRERSYEPISVVFRQYAGIMSRY